MPGHNHTRSLVLYVAIEAVGWVTVALGFLSAGAGLLSDVPEGSNLPFNVVAATPGVTLAVAGLFAAGLAHHGRVTLDMARSLRHLVHLAAIAAEAQPVAQVPVAASVVAPPEVEAPVPIEPRSAFEPAAAELSPAPEPIFEPEPPVPPTLPPADLIIPPLPPLPPLEPQPVRTPPTPLFADFEPDAEPAMADEPPPAEPQPPSESGEDEPGTPEPAEALPPGEPDIVVYRNVQIELRPDGIFIRDRQFATVDEARTFIDRVLDRAPR